MDAIETFEHNGLSVSIYQDETPLEPDQFEIAIYDRYNGIGSPELIKQITNDKSLLSVTLEFVEMLKGTRIYLVAYIKRNQISRKDFPTNQIAIDAMKSFLKMYQQYLEGDVYGIVIEENGEIIESCWGFYGFDYAKEQAKEMAKSCAKMIENREVFYKNCFAM